MKSVKQFTHKLWGIPEIRGIGSLGFLRYATKALALGRLLIVTRWFSPAEMGALGAALLILAIAEITTETGVNFILMKHPEKLKSYIHTAWLVSLLRGIMIAGVILALIPTLQRFFETPLLGSLLGLCALAALIKGAINPAIITYQQTLQFGKETLFRTPLQLLELVSGLFLAWWLQSVSGLLLGLIVAASAEVLTSFWLFKLRPNLLLARWSQLIELYKETRAIVANGIIQYFTEHSDDILIGRLLGPAALGVYQTAYKLVSAITTDLATVISQALFPILVSRANDQKHLRKTLVRTSSMFGLVMLPVAILLLVFPRQITALLLGPEWELVGVVLPWLFIGALAKAGLNLVTPLVVLRERVKYLLGINLYIVVAMLSGIAWWGPKYGVQGAAFAVALAMVTALPLTLLMTRSALRKHA
jgi:O-antigen/teichoic acid export membrane protein